MKQIYNHLKYFLFLFLASILCLNSHAQIPANVPTTNLIAWYGFTGNTQDSSGNGNHLVNNGATLTTDRNGVANSAYSFNGAGNNMTNLVPSFSFGANSSFTISFWMNKNNTTSGAMPYWHGLTQGNGGTNKFCHFFNTSAAGTTRWRVNKQGSPWINCQSSYTASAWVHIAVVYNNTSMKLYQNGVQVASNTFNYSNTITATMPMYIGSSSVGTAYFGGKLDDFGIWGRALTASEINVLYTNCTAPILGVTTSAISCDSYTTPGGKVYQTSGVYQDTVTSSGGCDSINTINLTINNTSADTVITTNCNSYTSVGGVVYDSTGIFYETYTNAVGCDSVIYLDVTIFNGYYFTINDTTCNTYTSPSGKTFTSSGTYLDTIVNGSGCDSLYTINLIVNQNTTETITETACDAYVSSNGITYTNSGTYTEVIPNANGCDSIITLNVTINTIDSSVTVNGNELTANIAGLTYRWLDCDDDYSPIPGGNTQSFTATESGNYAVKITDGSCIDTSSCYTISVVGIPAVNNKENLSMYPNPAHKVVSFTNIGDPITVQILSLTGEVVLSSQIPNGMKQIDISRLSSGLYLVSYSIDHERILRKLMVE